MAWDAEWLLILDCAPVHLGSEWRTKMKAVRLVLLYIAAGYTSVFAAA